MNKENQPNKPYETWNDEIIIELLRTKMSVRELISKLNENCTKQITIRGSYQTLVRHLIKLKSEGFVSLEQVIYKTGKVFDSTWKSTPEGGQHIYDSQQIKEAKKNILGDLGLAGA
jgi:DNA-binding transcriptional ArsR family regulator